MIFGHPVPTGILALALAVVFLILLPLPWSLLMVVPLAVVYAVVVAAVWQAHQRRVEAGPSELVGARGRITSPPSPLGTAQIGVSLWQVRCSRSLPVGSQVRVCAVRGLVLGVELDEDGALPQGTHLGP